METTNRHDTSGVTPENMAVAFAHTDTQTRFKVYAMELDWFNCDEALDHSAYSSLGMTEPEITCKSANGEMCKSAMIDLGMIFSVPCPSSSWY